MQDFKRRSLHIYSFLSLSLVKFGTLTRSHSGIRSPLRKFFLPLAHILSQNTRKVYYISRYMVESRFAKIVSAFISPPPPRRPIRFPYFLVTVSAIATRGSTKCTRRRLCNFFLSLSLFLSPCLSPLRETGHIFSLSKFESARRKTAN